MINKSKFNRIALAVAMSVGISSAAVAQVTSSDIAGQIFGPTGAPAAGTVVKVTHVPTGTTKMVTVTSTGAFNLKGLRVGGPYTIEIDSDEYVDQTINDVYLTLGETATIERQLAAEAEFENIVVTASQVGSLAFGQVGPRASFDLGTLQTAPAINRDITDIVRLDPRIYVDEGGNNGIQCVGKNPRFNSLTVDGIRMNDLFGLNSNGYPTERMPFSFDAIEGVAVEIAPFDVIYGGFSACNISAVSKSGTNEVHGSVFYDYGSDSLKGDSLEGQSVNSGSYTEERYGFTIGAPLIEDKLFIFAAYEKLEGANLFDRGSSDSNAVDKVAITQAELDQIVSIANNLYNYDPGVIPSSMPNEDEKLLVKVDWNISDAHRASFTYNYNDGNNFTYSDGDSDEIEFSNHLYERGAELKSLAGVLYSDWSDKFTTEIRVTKTELDNRQNSVGGDGTPGGNDFGEMQIYVGDVVVYIGSDDSRQANDLDWDALSLLFRGNYYMDNGHTLTFGYESNKLDVFNLFVQHTETEMRFYGGIDAFEQGLPGAIYYNYAISGELEDAAADWGYTEHSAFFQDDFYLTDDLKIVAGLRYDWYTTSDRPALNEDFVADYGFRNDANLDGVSLLQPRVSFNYTIDERTELHGGVGLFSGGNPNVWMSNNFSNTNTTQVGTRGRNFGYTDGSRSLFDDDIIWVNTEEGITPGPGYSIPSELDAAVDSGDGSNFDLNYLDPNFELPSEWKLAVGLTHVTESDYEFNVDLLLSFTQDQAMVKYANLEEVGTTDEGYIDYDSNKMSAIVLTNSDEISTSYSLTGTVNKTWDSGLNLVAGYSYNHSEDVQPMNSSVAFSNYNYRAFTNPNEDVSSVSDWNIRHRFTANLNYSAELIPGLPTTFSAFGVMQSGNVYSLTNSQNGSNGIFGFTPYLDSDSVLAMGTERNAEEASWWTKVDVAVIQEVPAFSDDHKASVSLIVDNLTNLISDDWGLLKETGNTQQNRSESIDGDASLWEIRFALNYRF